MVEGYAEAISLERIEKQLARCADRCAAQDAAYPPDVDCARAAVRQSVCPCVLGEDAVCNTLTTMVYRHFTEN